MAKRLFQRKTIYGATVVAMLLLITGFAVASYVNVITVSSSSGQNTGNSASTTNTVWGSGTVDVALVQATAGTCPTTSISATSTTKVYLAAGSACGTSGANEWYEEFAFPSVNYVAGASDTFVFYVVGGYSGAASQTFTITNSGTSAISAMVLDVYLDMGPATANPSQVTGSISFTVTGS